MSKLILPGDPLFDLTLSTSFPPNGRQVSSQNSSQCAFITRLETGVMEAVINADLDEYLFGGEYQERQVLIGE